MPDDQPFVELKPQEYAKLNPEQKRLYDQKLLERQMGDEDGEETPEPAPKKKPGRPKKSPDSTKPDGESDTPESDVEENDEEEVESVSESEVNNDETPPTKVKSKNTQLLDDAAKDLDSARAGINRDLLPKDQESLATMLEANQIEMINLKRSYGELEAELKAARLTASKVEEVQARIATIKRFNAGNWKRLSRLCREELFEVFAMQVNDGDVPGAVGPVDVIYVPNDKTRPFMLVNHVSARLFCAHVEEDIWDLQVLRSR